MDVFFVISGFIMCQISAAERGRFFLYRMARIVPLYWAATLAVFSIATIKPTLLNSTTADVGNLISSLLFIPHTRANGIVLPILGLGWTLNYEMFFYGMFAICLLVLPPKAAPLACAAGLCGLALIGLEFALPSPWDFWANLQVLEFVAGLGLYYLYNSWRGALQRTHVAVLGTVAAAALAAMVAEAVIVPGHSIGFFMPCAFAILLAALGLEGRMTVPVAILAIGDASYSLYLLHP